MFRNKKGDRLKPAPCYPSITTAKTLRTTCSDWWCCVSYTWSCGSEQCSV